MMIEDQVDTKYRVQFLVEGGKVPEVIKEYESKRDEVWDKWTEFSKRYGSSKIYCDSIFKGIVFDSGNVPEGWIHRQSDPYGVCVPKSRTKERKEMDSLPRLPYWNNFSEMLGWPGLIVDDSRFIDVFYEEIGEIVILHVPRQIVQNGYEIPEGCKQLKASEYFQIREQHTEGAVC